MGIENKITKIVKEYLFWIALALLVGFAMGYLQAGLNWG
jgi:hypothetical protein